MRVIAPAERTDGVRRLLVEAPGATHVSVLPGVAVQPPGDVVEADVAREAVDDLLEQLRALGVDRAGGVTLQVIDTSLSDAADAAEEAAPGDPQDAVIWDEVVARTGEESRFSGGSAGMLALTSAKSASLVGVFISVTTVPAAAFASVALVEGRYLQALESAAQLAINLGGIVVAAAAVLLLWRRSHPRGGGRRLSAG